MALAYTKPGVTINEIVSPSFSPLLLDPTSICLVGPAQGYQSNTEIFVLDDNTPVQLQKLNIDPTSVVVLDASNVTGSAFVATGATNADYTVDTSKLATTGVATIARSMQTTIENGETVVVYFENSASPTQADGKTDFVELDGLTAGIPSDRASGTQAASIKVMKAGLAPADDYTISAPGVGMTIVWTGGAGVIGKFQTLYLDYVDGSSVQHTDVAVQLNNLTTVTLGDNLTNIVVKTKAAADTGTTSSLYTKGTTTDGDYIVGGSGATTTIQRSAGTTTINPSHVAGDLTDKLAVRVSYNATPSDYWLPTRCFTQYDVEQKYGPAWDSSGNILNPLSFAASMAFANGATSVVCQALFAAGTPNTNPTGSLTDWENTLQNLYNIEDINVVVPIISAGNLTTTFSDTLSLQIFEAVQNFCAYMAQNQNQLIIAILGEDATNGVLASPTTLQSHAASLGANDPYSEHIVLLSPASFAIGNPVTGLPTNIGGQYVAAGVAGMLARYAVQTPLTRKQVNALTGVNVARTESEKDSDAASGCLVVEAKLGRIQVRDAITTSQVSISSRALNVVRAKHYMMENIRQVLDSQVVGQIVLDDQANFTVQLLVQNELELLVENATIVSYDAIQCSADPNDPTALQVRFSYLPAYPLNRVSINFSIDQSSGVTFNSTTTSNVQGI